MALKARILRSSTASMKKAASISKHARTLGKQGGRPRKDTIGSQEI
jgi:hypothetical protein